VQGIGKLEGLVPVNVWLPMPELRMSIGVPPGVSASWNSFVAALTT
jgi:hypothetical protein